MRVYRHTIYPNSSSKNRNQKFLFSYTGFLYFTPVFFSSKKSYITLVWSLYRYILLSVFPGTVVFAFSFYFHSCFEYVEISLCLNFIIRSSNLFPITFIRFSHYFVIPTIVYTGWTKLVVSMGYLRNYKTWRKTDLALLMLFSRLVQWCSLLYIFVTTEYAIFRFLVEMTIAHNFVVV